jgi:hypothetical protein
MGPTSSVAASSFDSGHAGLTKLTGYAPPSGHSGGLVRRLCVVCALPPEDDDDDAALGRWVSRELALVIVMSGELLFFDCVYFFRMRY